MASASNSLRVEELLFPHSQLDQLNFLCRNSGASTTSPDQLVFPVSVTSDSESDDGSESDDDSESEDLPELEVEQPPPTAPRYQPYEPGYSSDYENQFRARDAANDEDDSSDSDSESDISGIFASIEAPPRGPFNEQAHIDWARRAALAMQGRDSTLPVSPSPAPDPGSPDAYTSVDIPSSPPTNEAGANTTMSSPPPTDETGDNSAFLDPSGESERPRISRSDGLHSASAKRRRIG